MTTVKIFVTGILVLWRVMDSWHAWECLCGHDVCEWCSNPPPAPEWLYGEGYRVSHGWVTMYDVGA